MKNKGQMLIEIVVAVGVLALVLIGVSDLMTRSARVSGYQAKRDEANSIARELLNDYRIQKENDPDNFEDIASGLSREVCVEGKDYSCLVTVTKNTGSVDLLVTVSWPDGNNILSISINQTLTSP